MMNSSDPLVPRRLVPPRSGSDGAAAPGRPKTFEFSVEAANRRHAKREKDEHTQAIQRQEGEGGITREDHTPANDVA
ncbi:MAG: hypothetical protein ACJ8LN_17525 [Sulfurifustis sp.]